MPASSISIAEALRRELKDAMKARDRRRINAIRQVETEVSVAKAEPGAGAEADDDLYRRVLERYVKKMDKARREYEALGERGAEQAEKLAFEVEYLSQWLPQKLDEAATRELVDQALQELGIEPGVGDAKLVGRVIGYVMKSGAEVDGALVNRIVRERLGV